MAQILKEEQKQAIIEAARQELLENGYKDASMRNIAAKADMTVGNLYRYFKSKEDLQRYILGDTYEKISSILMELSADTVSKEPRVFNVKADVHDLSDLMDRLADRLVSVLKQNHDEFMILLNDQDIDEKFRSWFERTLHSLVDQHYLRDDQQLQKQVLTNAYVKAIYTGLKEIFKNTESDSDALTDIIKTYLHSYVIMLDEDLKHPEDAYAFYHIQNPEN